MPPSARPTLRMVPRHKPAKGGDARVARLVPWIFRNEAANVDELRAAAPAAVLVNVENSEGRGIGSAVCNLQKGGSTGVNLLARILADNASLPIDRAFFAHHVRRALEHRERFFAGSLYYRLLNAEGDLLPGILCDRFGDVLCVQFISAAMELLFENEVLDALQEAVKPQAIVQRWDARIDRQLELAAIRAPSVVRGHYTRPTILPQEFGFSFQIDLLAADLSSGRFFEDRALRALLASSLKPQDDKAATCPLRVLSLFSDSLGPLCATLGAHVTCGVAASTAGKLEQHRLEGLAAMNQCAQRMEYLNFTVPGPPPVWPEAAQAFDIVTLEPPAFAPTYGQLEEGMRQYTAWVAAAVAAVKVRGLLLMTCRSRTMTTVRLLRCINLGVWSCGRRAQLLHRSAAAPSDFPMHMALLDTGEFQTLVLRVL